VRIQAYRLHLKNELFGFRGLKLCKSVRTCKPKVFTIPIFPYVYYVLDKLKREKYNPPDIIKGTKLNKFKKCEQGILIHVLLIDLTMHKSRINFMFKKLIYPQSALAAETISD
jgi:hypothetical protein